MTFSSSMPQSPQLPHLRSRTKTFAATVAAFCAVFGLLGASAAQAQSGNAGQAFVDKLLFDIVDHNVETACRGNLSNTAAHLASADNAACFHFHCSTLLC